MELSDWLLVSSITVSAFVAIIGWIIVHAFNRRLQRQQLAITLCNSHRFEPVYRKSVRLILDNIKPGNAQNTHNLAHNRGLTGNPANSQDKELIDAVKIVLNYLEFMAIAVLSESVHGDVVWHSMSGTFESMSSRLLPYVEEIRSKDSDPSFFRSFTVLLKQWQAPSYKPPKRLRW